MRNEVVYALLGAAVLALALVLAFRLIRRDSGIRITRLGVFVERERFDDEPVDDDPTQEWPQRPS
jgi:hypothetical protein